MRRSHRRSNRAITGSSRRVGQPSRQCGGGAIPPPHPPTQTQCVEAFPAGNTVLAACADCRFSDGAFELPLPPGRYTLDFFRHDTLDLPEYHHLETVTVSARPMGRRYARSASGGGATLALPADWTALGTVPFTRFPSVVNTGFHVYRLSAAADTPPGRVARFAFIS